MTLPVLSLCARGNTSQKTWEFFNPEPISGEEKSSLEYEAQIGNKKYRSFQDACYAVKRGEKIVLLKNIQLKK